MRRPLVLTCKNSSTGRKLPSGVRVLPIRSTREATYATSDAACSPAFVRLKRPFRAHEDLYTPLISLQQVGPALGCTPAELTEALIYHSYGVLQG